MTPYEFGIKIAAGVDRGTQPLQPGPTPLTPALPKPTVNKPQAQQLPIKAPKTQASAVPKPATPAAPAVPPRFLSRQDAVTMGDKARANGYGGSVAEAFVHDPKNLTVVRDPATEAAMKAMEDKKRSEIQQQNQAYRYTPPTPAQQQMRQTLQQQHPYMHSGEIQDMISLRTQNAPQARINTFINSTRNRGLNSAK